MQLCEPFQRTHRDWSAAGSCGSCYFKIFEPCLLVYFTEKEVPEGIANFIKRFHILSGQAHTISS